VSSNRFFAITDYEAQAAEEPLNEDGFGGFLDELSTHGSGFEARLLDLLGRKDLRPLALSSFPGFRLVLEHEKLVMVNAISSRYRDQRQPFVLRTLALTVRWSFTPVNPAGCQNTSSRVERAGSTRLLDPMEQNACSTHGRKQSLPVWRRANRTSDNLRRPLLRAAKTDSAPTKNSEACGRCGAMSPF
jgi:hypothetical protein